MEARVDIQKLQMLCDRINQAAEALDQVRMSVSGLSHTGQAPFYGFAQSPVYGQPLQYQALQPVIPWQQQALPPLYSGVGLQHSVDPRLNPIYAANMPVGYGLPAGIQHTGAEDVERRILEARANDPYRIGITFPFVFSGERIRPW